MTLPNIENNYLKGLDFYTPTLYREVNPRNALNLLDTNIMSDIGEQYFSNTRDLARGQGLNQGIMLELDSKGIQGQVNRNKPGWDFNYNQGNAEFIAKHNPKESYTNNIKSIEITGKQPIKDAYYIRLKKMLSNNPEWTKTITDSGTVKFIKNAGKTLKALPLGELGLIPDYLPALDLIMTKDKSQYNKKLQKMFDNAGINYNNGQIQL